jgi:hypothetical protein
LHVYQWRIQLPHEHSNLIQLCEPVWINRPNVPLPVIESTLRSLHTGADMLKSLALFALLFSLPISAQVQLGGHVYVPSTTDSTNGLTIVTFTANGNCNIVKQINCVLTSSSGGTFDASLPYTGTLIVNDPSNLLTENRSVFLPLSPGRQYNVENNTSFTLDFQSTAMESGVLVSPGLLFASIWSDGSFYNNPSAPCNGNPGFIAEFTEFACEASPIDDGLTNPNFLTSSEGMVWLYNVNSFAGFVSYVGFDDPSPSPGSEDVFLGANIHDVDSGSGTGTLFNTNVGAAAISFHTPDQTGTGCVELWGTSNFGVSTLTNIAAFCQDQIVFNVPVQSHSDVCVSSTSPAVCGNFPDGFVSFPTSGTLTVNTTAVTANSQISVQYDQSLGSTLGVTCQVASVNAPVGVITSRVPGTSFTFEAFGPTFTNPGCFSYTIVN